MQKYKVSNEGRALAYITDCMLATVCTMASKKSRPKYEFERQISIAQCAIDWMIEFNIDFSMTRAQDVVALGGVKEWAKQYMPDVELASPPIEKLPTEN